MNNPWEAEITNRLRNFPDLRAITGGRVRPLLLFQNDPVPSVTYAWSDVRPKEHLMGRDTPEVTGQLTVKGWAKSYEEAKAAGIEAAKALSRWPLDPGYDESAGSLSDIYLLSYADDYDEDIEFYARIYLFQVEATGSITA